ncbi:MAG: transcriptional regulator [Oscillospiraceae bacterium]|jgi:inhibitor of the pro-sigma K processing machinery|nr:transcriptional regulator [Oscillospiraceae bacterium]
MEGLWITTLPWLLGSLGVVLALALLRRPLSSLLRLAGRTGLGLCFLTLFAPIGQLLGAGLGINLFNALILGLLGAPGFGLLLMLNWALH